MDIERDFLEPRGLTLEQVEPGMSDTAKGLRMEIDEIVKSDYNVASIRLIRADGLMLYDHSTPENVGLPYPSRHH